MTPHAARCGSGKPGRHGARGEREMAIGDAFVLEAIGASQYGEVPPHLF